MTDQQNPQQSWQPQNPQQQQPQPQPNGASQIPYQQMPNQQFASQQYASQQYMPQQFPGQPVSAVNTPSDSDRQLRLVAFIFMLLSTISVGWTIVPLAWMIPMTVVCWDIYKGKKPNGTAFGVCTLLFVSLVAGICLLVSTKEK